MGGTRNVSETYVLHVGGWRCAGFAVSAMSGYTLKARFPR